MPLLVGSAAIAAADIARRIFRHTQIFCPSPDPVKTWNPADYGIPDGAVEEVSFETPDGEELYGWYCRSEKPIASGVFCHGNTGNLTTTAEVIPHLLSAGFNVLFFDYRGFGKSTGIATFRGVISDGVTASRFHDRIRPKDLPTVLY
ncbi:MAG TPA: alpha/beta fold hydrolase, partial [Thermoanaerobaculia bacterium]|nr:alpha/beta fold hydrolase [Thermoanaerobaculia bacterium]